MHFVIFFYGHNSLLIIAVAFLLRPRMCSEGMSDLNNRDHDGYCFLTIDFCSNLALQLVQGPVTSVGHKIPFVWGWASPSGRSPFLPRQRRSDSFRYSLLPSSQPKYPWCVRSRVQICTGHCPLFFSPFDQSSS